MHGSKCNGLEHSKVRFSAISFPREIACKIDNKLSQPLFIYLLILFVYDLDKLYSERFSFNLCYRSPSPDSGGKLFSAVDGIEDTLYYFSDVISAGIPDIGRLITDHILQHLTLPLLLPSLCSEAVNDISVDPVTSLYLLSCILRIVKIKDLANMTAATLFCPVKAFISSSLVKPNSSLAPEGLTYVNGHPDKGVTEEANQQCSSTAAGMSDDGNSHLCSEDTPKSIFNNSHMTFRETLLQYISEGDDVQAQGSLFVLATLLQTKELEESMLDAFGILPQRKQHKKLLLQSLVGEDTGEEQLFSPRNGSMRDGLSSELDWYLRRLEVLHCIS
jgi:protein CLEC16A